MEVSVQQLNELIVKGHTWRATKESFIRYRYTPAFEWKEEETAALAEEAAENIPAYTLNCEWYAVCNAFNKNLYNRTWPHKTVCKISKKEEGTINNFALSIILQNIFNINGEDHLDTSIEDFCICLADYLAS